MKDIIGVSVQIKDELNVRAKSIKLFKSFQRDSLTLIQEIRREKLLHDINLVTRLIRR